MGKFTLSGRTEMCKIEVGRLRISKSHQKKATTLKLSGQIGAKVCIG